MRGTSALNSQKRWREKKRNVQGERIFSLEKREKGEESPKDTQEIAAGGKRYNAPYRTRAWSVWGRECGGVQSIACPSPPSQTRAGRGMNEIEEKKARLSSFPPPPPTSRAISPFASSSPLSNRVYIYVVCA